ncbi:acyl-CoA dehydrogenase [Brevibacterium permense]|uniref:acyl-CoA dehydrogenase family protein n=1 Tax=Brevibacterium permense TaxID=234834 RepID=UPI0021D018FF|nr:acyl-CoA dehydrogenase family protein [Brevibacterium permense]MCU4296106.1 acyl-CoA dehydrogenase [Brevibacterium permense]
MQTGVQSILASPLDDWYGLPSSDLAETVRGTADPPTTILRLQSFFGLSGTSSQIDQWEALATVASLDVAAARMLEPHLDALGILEEAGHLCPEPRSTWGVFAAEAPDSVVTISDEGGHPMLDGKKAWCSLAGELSHAVVIAHRGEARQTCAVSLDHPGVTHDGDHWPSVGLKEIPSGPITLRRVPAEEIGTPGWYLERPSFAWGGIRVAACWFGGALGMARIAARQHFSRGRPAPMGNLALGQLDAEIFACRSAFAQAAEAADGDLGYSRAQSWKLALQVRNIVYRACQRIQLLSRELAGPASLTGDHVFAKADADLTVYLSQHHGPRDEESLGIEILKAGRQ